MELLFWLVAGHFVADYPLQGDFLARGKNHTAPIAGVPWQQCLLAHAFIHGGMVALITGHVGLGLLEVALHAWIDFGKCQKIFGFNIDQALHIVCKIIYVLLLRGV